MTIVYQSQTGFTKQYAELLALATGLTVLPLQQALSTLPAGKAVLFMGWLMAGRINGLKQALKLWNVRCIAGVGMAPANDEIAATLSATNQVGGCPVFYLPGGWAPKQVNPIQRWAVNMVTRSKRKMLQTEAPQSPQAQAYLNMLTRGGSFVDGENLAPIVKWCNEHE